MSVADQSWEHMTEEIDELLEDDAVRRYGIDISSYLSERSDEAVEFTRDDVANERNMPENDAGRVLERFQRLEGFEADGARYRFEGDAEALEEKFEQIGYRPRDMDRLLENETERREDSLRRYGLEILEYVQDEVERKREKYGAVKDEYRFRSGNMSDELEAPRTKISQAASVLERVSGVENMSKNTLVKLDRLPEIKQELKKYSLPTISEEREYAERIIDEEGEMSEEELREKILRRNDYPDSYSFTRDMIRGRVEQSDKLEWDDCVVSMYE